MITSEVLNFLISCNAKTLSTLLKKNGFTNCGFSSVKFLGITNGGQFCYSVTYFDDTGTGAATDKVFLTYDVNEDKITADF